MLEIISCGCKTGTCTTNRSLFHRHQLKCSDVCGYQNCSNHSQIGSDDESEAE